MQTIKEFFDDKKQKGLARLRSSSRYRPVSDQEYARLKMEQSAKLAAQEAANYRVDYSRLGITEAESKLTWEHVKPNVSDGMKAVQAVRPAYERGYGVVFLWGTYGQAKTLIGKILTATAFRDGKRAAYANLSRMLDDIRLAFDEPEHKTTELLRRMEWWNERDVLFLDELDKVNSTEWSQERMFQLLDQRYTRAVREEALTVIASNRSDDALDGYLKSRLHDRRVGVVVHLNGPDARKVMPEGYHF